MRTPKKTHDLIRQNEHVVKKSQKHDTNLQKNSIFYFQVGLVVCLLAAYGLFEMKFQYEIPKVVHRGEPATLHEFVMDVLYKPETPKKSEPINDKKIVSKFLPPEIVPDEVPILPFDVPVLMAKQPELDPSSIKVDNMPDDDILVPIGFIEQAPIYPGCENEKSNDARRQCMSEKITKLIQKQFNTDLASGLGLTGRQVIRAQFKIDKTGHVGDIQIQAFHPKLKDEAARVINKIPEMTPGKQHNKNVGVIYFLPIVFDVQN